MCCWIAVDEKTGYGVRDLDEGQRLNIGHLALSESALRIANLLNDVDRAEEAERLEVLRRNDHS